MESTKKINCEAHKKFIEALKIIVPDQTMRLIDTEGKVWRSSARDIGGMALTTIKRNGEDVANIIYDYETGREETFLY